MIDFVDARPKPVAPAAAATALLARFAPATAAAPADAGPAPSTPREWVEYLASRLPAAATFAIVEHLFGVLPLLDAWFPPRPAGSLADLAAGRRLAALGLFTPAPLPGWDAAAVDGEPDGGGALRLGGEIRIPLASADGSLVLVSLAATGEHRLAWLDHASPGATRHGARRGGGPHAGDGGGPCWMALAGALVSAEHVSPPVALDASGPLRRSLAGYAGVWALAAALCARRGAASLRRAARTTLHRGTPFSASQLATLGITEVEIEAELAVAAARLRLADEAGPGSADTAPALAAALAAAGALAAVAARAAELGERLGLPPHALLGADGGAPLTAFLGGTPHLESELATVLGIKDGADGKAGPAAGASPATGGASRRAAE